MDQEEQKKNLISLENCDFSNTSNILNSPRSLQACLQLGIEISELYQLTMDEFKKKYPEVKNLSDDLIQLRYDAEEKFRNDTIKQAKEERNKIIEENEKEKNINKQENNNDEQSGANKQRINNKSKRGERSNKKRKRRRSQKRTRT